MEYIFGIVLTFIISFVFYSIFKKKPKQKSITIVNTEINWKPKPLVDQIRSESSIENSSPTIVNSKVGKWIKVDGKRLLNFASHNYLNLIENDYINAQAKNAIYKYGVGSCGPRGFYGTVDVHLELESRLAKFMKTETAIVYSYGFTTVASAIAAYVKKNDVIFADEKVNFAIQRGVEASRCKVYYFKHNDPKDLENLLKSFALDKNENTKRKSEPRKFLIAEGIYINSGKICPLPELIEIRKRYKLRLFLDESISFGVLGEHGRGVVEYFNEDMEDVDMIMASMEFALCTGGGFCVGSAFIVEHQRLSGLGYCFSASLPPFLAVAARAGIDIIEQENDRIRTLSKRCSKLQASLSESFILRNNFLIESDEFSPIKHLILKSCYDTNDAYVEKVHILNKIVSRCKNGGVLITVANYLIFAEHIKPPASIRLTISCMIEDDEIARLIRLLEEATIAVVNENS